MFERVRKRMKGLELFRHGRVERVGFVFSWVGCGEDCGRGERLAAGGGSLEGRALGTGWNAKATWKGSRR